MKVTSNAEDTLIQSLIDSATEWGENYTGRDFRDNQWKLLLDSFFDVGNSSERFQHQHLSSGGSVLPYAHPSHRLGVADNERIELKRDPVDTVDSVTHIVSGSPVVVPGTDYYLKKNTQSSEVLLVDGKDWPTDTDMREQAIEVLFTTKAYRNINQIKDAILRHVSNLYTNRGDCDGCGGTDLAGSAEKSGATAIYDQFRISRV